MRSAYQQARRLARAAGCAVLVVSAATGLAACGSDSDSSSGGGGTTDGAAAAKTAIPLAYFATQLNNPFIQAEIKGAKDAAAAEGSSVKVYNANFDPQAQLAQCQDAIASGKFKALAIDAVVGTAMVPCVNQAKAKDIKVVAINSPIGPDQNTLKPQYPGVTGTVLVPAGVIADVHVNYMKEACKGKSNCPVARIIGQPGFGADATWTKLINQKLKNEPNIKVVATGVGKFTEAGAQTAAQNIIAAHPDVTIIASMADQMAMGAAKAAKNAGKLKQIAIVGSGGSDQAQEAICAGDWLATVNDRPYSTGKTAATIAIQQGRGENPKSEIDIAQPPSINQDNCKTVKGEFSIR